MMMPACPCANFIIREPCLALGPLEAVFYTMLGLDNACRPAGEEAVAGLTQQPAQQDPNLRNGQRRRIFFSPVVSPESKTTGQ